MAEDELGREFKCDFMKYKDGSSIPICTATNKDLVTACEYCEINPASEEEPYPELCEECKKAQLKEDEEMGYKSDDETLKKGAEP